MCVEEDLRTQQWRIHKQLIYPESELFFFQLKGNRIIILLQRVREMTRFQCVCCIPAI